MQSQEASEASILAFLGRAYGLLLYAYPARFRQEFGPDMAQVFRDAGRAALHDRGLIGLAGFLLFALLDLSQTVLVEHLASFNLEGSMISYDDLVSANVENAGEMEQVYQEALKDGDVEAFKSAIEESYHAAPDNLLVAAWFYRLQQMSTQVKEAFVAWGWVIPLALVNGLLFWLISDDQRFQLHFVGPDTITNTIWIPTFLVLIAPIAAVFVLSYLTAVSRKRWRFSLGTSFVLAAACAYVIGVYPQLGTRPFQEQYLILMALHLPLLAWAGVGFYTTAEQFDPARPHQTNIFAFLVKSLEVFIMAGLCVIAGGLFTGITVSLFAALDIEFSELAMRFFVAGGGGLIPVVATAVIYNPRVQPAEQAFDEGLSKLVSLLMRLLLPFTLLVLLVYVAFIPFNFRAPFENREVLIVYNTMLFAVIALLVGATPVSLADLGPRIQVWLRRGIIALAALALLTGLYALAAILYRTSLDRLTPNRLAFIGWNIVNIGLLFLLLFHQRSGQQQWTRKLYAAYRIGAVGYAAWALVMILTLPWLFGINKAQIEALPLEVQEIVYEQPDPILLKCDDSPHIYLLQGGEKRWVDSLETFEDRGYAWRDVNFIACDMLDNIPAGVPIPADAGSPPLE